MKITCTAEFEYTIEGKTGKFLLDHDTPTGIATMMGIEFIKEIAVIDTTAKAKVEENKKDEEKPELTIADEQSTSE